MTETRLVNECNWCERVIEKSDERWHVSELGTIAAFHSACWDEWLAKQPGDEGPGKKRRA